MRSVYVGLSLWIAILPAFSQEMLESLPVWRLLTRADGLGANNVRDILRDPKGDFWFATSGGVTRFDGLWQTFTRAHGLPANDVRSLAFDSVSGSLWVATGSGLGRLVQNGTQWEARPAGEGSPTGECFVVLVATSGVWVGTRGGLYRWDGVVWSVVEGTRGVAVRALAWDGVGTLGYLRDGPFEGVPLFGRIGAFQESPLEIPLPELMTATSARALLALGEGLWWVGGTEGLFAFDGEWHSLPSPANSLNVNALFRASDGTIWISATRGAYQVTGDRWKVFTAAEGLPSGVVQRVFVDANAGIWIATSNGVAFSDGSWGRYALTNSINDLAADVEGNLWLGTSSGLLRLREGTVQQYGSEEGLPGLRVRVVKIGPDGRPWVGVSGPQGGLGIPHERGWRTVRAADGIGESNEVYALTFDRAGRLWVGTGFLREPEVDFLGGVARLDEKGWKFWKTDATPVALAEDARGVLWAGTLSRGLLRFNGEEFVVEPTPFGVEIRALLRDSRGLLWAGTSDGLFRFDGQEWEEFGVGLPGSSVRALFEDNQGRLWVGLDEGLAVWDEGHEWTTFTLDENEGLHAFAETRDGLLWLAGTTLLVHRPSFFAPQTRIVRAPQGVIGETGVLISFEGGDPYTPREALRYSYRLNGGAWTIPSRRTEVFLSGFPQGMTVVFDVRAVNGDGVADPTPARAVFHVDAEPPTAEIAFPLPNTFVRGEVLLLGRAFDPSDFDFYRVEVNDRIFFELHSPVRDGVLARWDTRQSPDGEVTIRLFVADRRDGEYDTVHSVSRTVVVHVDNTPPEAELVLPEGSLSGRVEVRLRMADAFLAAWRLEVALSPPEWRLLATGNGESEERLFSWDTSALDGPVLLRLSVSDVAGNETILIKSLSLSNPEARPLVQWLAPAEGSVVRREVVIGGTVSDTSLKGYEVRVRREENPEWVVVVRGENSVQGGNLGVWDTSSFPDGRYFVQVLAEDVDGYKTLSSPIELTVDNTPPVFLEMVSPMAEGLFSGSEPLKILARIREANRAQYRLEFSLVSGVWESVALGEVDSDGSLAVVWTPPALDGIVFLRLSAIDAAGWEMIPYIRTVRFDGSLPRVLVDEPLAGSLLEGEVLIRGTVEDEHFAFYEVAVQVGEGEWKSLIRGDRPIRDGVLATWKTPIGEDDVLLQVRVEDAVGWKREITIPVRFDNQAPRVSLVFPTPNLQVTGVLEVKGVVHDAHLLAYRVEWRPAQEGAQWILVAEERSSGVEGRLAVWNAVGAPGRAVLRVTARDQLGHEAFAETEVVLASVAEPRKFSFIASVDGKVRLYIPPNALPSSTAVTVNAVPAETLGALVAYRLEPSELVFDPRKPAALEFEVEGAEELGIALWEPERGSWRWLGGTREGSLLRLGIFRLGVYGLVPGGSDVGEGDLRLRCQPRAFQPHGGEKTVLTFYLREASRVTVKVYHGSGRLVSRLVDDEFRSGEHALTWDGRDEYGRTLPNGLYLLHVKTRFAASQIVVLVWNP